MFRLLLTSENTDLQFDASMLSGFQNPVFREDQSLAIVNCNRATRHFIGNDAQGGRDVNRTAPRVGYAIDVQRNE